jgi:hypothetical protein
MRAQILLRCAALGALGLQAGCLDEIWVDSTRVVPSALAVPAISSLVLAPIAGDGGPLLQRCIEEALLDNGIFELVHADADANLPELQHGAPSWGQGDAVLVGEVAHRHVYADVLWEERPTAHGGVETLYTRAGTIILRAQFRVVDARSGATLGSTTLEQQQALPSLTAVRPGPGSLQVARGPELFAPQGGPPSFEAVACGLAEALRTQLVPQRLPTHVMLYHRPDLPESDAALDAAVHGLWLEAADIYRAAALHLDALEAPARVRAAAHYNLGVALGAAGAFDDGLAELRLAQRHTFSMRHRQAIHRLVREQREAEAAHLQRPLTWRGLPEAA